jgi:hypothetical protein
VSTSSSTSSSYTTWYLTQHYDLLSPNLLFNFNITYFSLFSTDYQQGWNSLSRDELLPDHVMYYCPITWCNIVWWRCQLRHNVNKVSSVYSYFMPNWESVKTVVPSTDTCFCP